MQDKRSIVQICAYYPPHLGGLERVAKEISEQLARDGYAVTVLTSNVGAKKMPQVERSSNLIVKRLQTFDFAHTAFILGLLWQLLRVRKPTIFHLHLAQAYVPEMVWLASRSRGIPYVVHFHLDVEPSGRLGFMFVWWKRWIQPVIIKGAARVIVLSPEQSKLVRDRYGVSADKVAVIENGVGQQFLQVGKTERSFYDPLRLIFVGRLSAQKRPERLVEALALVRTPVTLTFVGDGEYRAKLESLVAQRGLKNVVFRGTLLGDDLLEAYRQADVFVTSSEREGMSLAILEAMAAGLPVIGIDALGIRELIEDVGILVPDPNPESFAHAIEDVATRREHLRELSRAGFHKAQQYSWERLVGKLGSLYEGIQV